MPNERSQSLKTGKQVEKRVFVITPIGIDGSAERRHADWVLNAAIKPVFEPRGYDVYRSDTIADPAMINDAIFNHVVDDEICIADLSFLNPNVFYELGVRHALSRPVIHIAHDLVKLPFDTAQHRAIFFSLENYHSVENLKRALAAQLDTIESSGFKVSNPLTHARGRQDLAESADSKDQIIAELLTRFEAIERRFGSEARHILPQNVTWASALSNNAASSVAVGREMAKLTDALSTDNHENYSNFRAKFGDQLKSMSIEERRILTKLASQVLDPEATHRLEKWVRLASQ
jgi:hypothetical protein